jgi:hypothetical protein
MSRDYFNYFSSQICSGPGSSEKRSSGVGRMQCFYCDARSRYQEDDAARHFCSTRHQYRYHSAMTQLWTILEKSGAEVRRLLRRHKHNVREMRQQLCDSSSSESITPHDDKLDSVLLEQMTEEMIIAVLLRFAPSYMSVPTHLVRLLSLYDLSKRFRHVIQSHFLCLIRLSLHTLTDTLPNDTLHLLTALESLDLQQRREPVSGEVLRRMRHLHTLILPECSCEIFDEDLTPLHSCLTYLELNSRNHYITDKGIAALTGLRTLVLPAADDEFECDGPFVRDTITDRSLTKLLRLETLHLGCNSTITAQALFQLSALTTLCLGEARRFLDSDVQQLTGLTQLGLGEQNRLSGACWHPLTQLQTLVMDYACWENPRFTQNDMWQLTAVHTLLLGCASALPNNTFHGLTALTQLDEGENGFIGDALRDATQLRHLTLGTSSAYGDADLQHLTRLETLRAFASQSVLSHHCFRALSRLTALDIREASCASLQHLSTLTSLSCDRLTLSSMRILELPRLEQLLVTRAATLDDVQLLHWTALVSLELEAYISSVTECALLRLPRLQYLSVDKRQLSDQGFLQLEERGVTVVLY